VNAVPYSRIRQKEQPLVTRQHRLLVNAMISVFKMFGIFVLQPERLEPAFPAMPMGVPVVVAASCLMGCTNFEVGAFCVQMSL
jgi:hypothetical protein